MKKIKKNYHVSYRSLVCKNSVWRANFETKKEANEFEKNPDDQSLSLACLLYVNELLGNLESLLDDLNSKTNYQNSILKEIDKKLKKLKS